MIIATEPSIYAFLPFVTTVALGLGFLIVFRQRAAARRVTREQGPMHAAIAGSRARERSLPEQPWWGNPLFWVAVCAVSLVLGILVWPGLFGGVFIVLPFVWIWRPRREPRMDPRTNGHTSRDAGSFTGD
ncbi:MAG: hypothetical protein M3P43_05210 [Actinomycetota bacterium]|nr:hypothetical protein [Actinomycetota bacterium]